MNQGATEPNWCQSCGHELRMAWEFLAVKASSWLTFVCKISTRKKIKQSTTLFLRKSHYDLSDCWRKKTNIWFNVNHWWKQMWLEPSSVAEVHCFWAKTTEQQWDLRSDALNCLEKDPTIVLHPWEHLKGMAAKQWLYLMFQIYEPSVTVTRELSAVMTFTNSVQAQT